MEPSQVRRAVEAARSTACELGLQVNDALFIDLHTCQRGPVEYDIAYAPEEVAALYPGANQHLVHQFRALMWAGFTTMRWHSWDQLPNRDYWRVAGLNQLRAALDRG